MKYSFNPETENLLIKYRIYLTDNGYSTGTIRQASNYTGYFLEWLQSDGLTPEDVRYSDMLNFIDYCRINGDNTRLINRRLGSIRNYYSYLKREKKENLTCPAKDLFIRGEVNRIPSGIIPYEDLEHMYISYNPETLRERRNKVIFGLLVYQALTTDELRRLETDSIDVKRGRVTVPGTRRSNGRELELKPFQILEMHEYLTDIRPSIIRGIDKNRPTRKPERINHQRIEQQLFISINGSEHIKNSLYHLFIDIGKLHKRSMTAKLVRMSVITHWLKHYNLRQVQYMAGHKYVSSTERYRLNNLETLQKEINRYHPLQ